MPAPKVLLETTKGNITLELFDEDAPLTVENFLKYVDDGHYNGTIFHRVIPGFMIQGGGMNSEMNQKQTRPPIKNEATNRVPNKLGSVAMARTGVVDSATSQFFINVRDNEFLNFQNATPQGYGYAVFGHVVDGLDVVTEIETVETASRFGHDDVPVEDVLIVKASRI